MFDIRQATPRHFARLAATTALAIILSACGGGGGGGSGFNSTPTPTPTPTPTKTCPDGSVIPVTATCPSPPPPPNYVNVFPGITTDTNFAVLGLRANALGSPASSLVSSGFAVRFDAATDAYVIDLPLAHSGNLTLYGQNSELWVARLNPDAGGGVNLTILKPFPTNPASPLQFTTVGRFDDWEGFYDYDVIPGGVLAFGTATPAGSVPTTGSATFDAIITGLTLDTANPVGGTASLQFNFGAGTLAGTFNPYLTYQQTSLGTYAFVNTVFGVGSTTFSGQLQHAGTPDLGAFNGLFTGPLAQELMAKWTAPYQNPDNNNWSEMFGVLVGKKP